MANFKRRKPKIRTYSHRNRRSWDKLFSKAPPGFLGSWPAWWDLLFHTRPKRRAEARELCRVLMDGDLDAGIFPLGSRRPHHYYW